MFSMRIRMAGTDFKAMAGTDFKATWLVLDNRHLGGFEPPRIFVLTKRILYPLGYGSFCKYEFFYFFQF